MASTATLFDGAVAEAVPVTVAAAGGAVAITRGDGAEDHVDPATLLLVEGSGPPRLARGDIPGWRLRFDRAPDPELAALLPRRSARYGRWIDRIGLWPAAAACAVVAAVVLAVGYSAPAWIAPLVPERWERDLGVALVGDFGDNRCRDAAGNRALRALGERIEPNIATGPDAIRFTAIDVAMFNAAALPGGQVVVFKDMLSGSSADALAGVLAHEIAHVRRRHVTQALVRELGIGALVRLFAGGVGANAQQLVALSYTRANEAEADRDAIAALTRAAIDPRPTARLFARLARHDGKAGGFNAEFLDSHPVNRERARQFAASFVPGRAYRPVLSRADAAALAAACRPGAIARAR